MTQQQQHPITPPPELVAAWCREADDIILENFLSEPLPSQVAAKAAQWGADQELDACLNWLTNRERFPVGHEAIEELKADRRPKPPSLKEQGIKSLDNVIDCLKSLVPGASVDGEDIKVIRRALEQLDD